jgi:hypothetical protein
MLGTDMNKNEWSQFYARLREIKRIQNPQLQQQQLQKLLADYPGAMALAKEKGDFGSDLVKQSGPAEMIQGPYQNPFSVSVGNLGGNISNALRTYAGGKMMKESHDARNKLSEEMTDERTKMANALMNQNSMAQSLRTPQDFYADTSNQQGMPLDPERIAEALGEEDDWRRRKRRW